MRNDQSYSIERLRRGTLHFLAGKAGSAALSFAAFVLVARLLTPAEYAQYVGALAVVEVCFAFASFGLDWVAVRYIPEYRVCAPARELRRFVMRLGTLQSVIYLLFAVTMWLGSGAIAGALGMPAARGVLAVYAYYLVVEACSRMLRDQMLGHLLLQGRAQGGLILRNLCWVAGLLWISDRGLGAIAGVALVESTAATVGFIASLVGLAFALRQWGGSASPRDPMWTPPDKGDLFVLARSNYLSYLLTLTYGPQLITFLFSRFVGVEATAAFGFARNLADQVRRYLPAELLYGLVRPALISRYAASRDVAAFNRSNALLLLVSLVFLAPVLVVGIAYGDLIVRTLGHGKFAGSAPLLTLLLLVLVPFSHRRIVELFANTVSQSAACARANAYLTGCGPLMVFMLWTHQPIWTLVAVLLLSELSFSALVVQQLHLAGVMYHLPWPALLRIALSVISSVGVLALMRVEGLVPENLLLSGSTAVLVTAAFLLVFRPLDGDDQARLRRLVA